MQCSEVLLGLQWLMAESGLLAFLESFAFPSMVRSSIERWLEGVASGVTGDLKSHQPSVGALTDLVKRCLTLNLQIVFGPLGTIGSLRSGQFWSPCGALDDWQVDPPD